MNRTVVRPHPARRWRWGPLLAVAVLASSCGAVATGEEGAEGALRVVVTTEILADLAVQVGGDRVEVHSVVPPGGDPHSYEPSPSDARLVTSADVAFTNHLLLEEHALIKLFDNNVPADAPNISLAEAAEQYGANLRPMVEDLGLDVLWLGLAVRGSGPSRSADVLLEATALEGPGDLFVYVTDAFGQPEVLYDSSDGFDESDVVVLPPGAHTHVNWAFTEPGGYRLTLAAAVRDGERAREDLGSGTFTFAVGDGTHEPEHGDALLLDDGHADLAVLLESGDVVPCTAKLSCADDVDDLDPDDVVLVVPDRAIVTVPDDERFGFLGTPGTEVWELPQAVLGKHVHGIVDPHLWQDVKNAAAYVQLMADVFSDADPDGRSTYEANRDEYLETLASLDREVRDRLATIPDEHRHLVTTHDAFGYLAEAYGLDVVGFVVPNPAQEPSAVQITRLTDTIADLEVPAVFLEPNLAARANVLRQVASDQDVQVCTILGDSFGEGIGSYVEMMRYNAAQVATCLRGR